jgi:hypothetical protein
MTTATYWITKQVNEELGQTDRVLNFSVAYMPSNTGEFVFNGSTKVKVMFYSLIVVMLFSLTPQLAQIVLEND